MSEEKQENLAAKVEQLEKRLDVTLDVISKLVKALDYMRSGDARFIFEMDLVKHSLIEAGYSEIATTEEKEASGHPSSLET